MLSTFPAPAAVQAEPVSRALLLISKRSGQVATDGYDERAKLGDSAPRHSCSRSREAERRYHVAGLVPNGATDTPDALLLLLVVNGEPATAHLCQRQLQVLLRSDRVASLQALRHQACTRQGPKNRSPCLRQRCAVAPCAQSRQTSEPGGATEPGLYRPPHRHPASPGWLSLRSSPSTAEGSDGPPDASQNGHETTVRAVAPECPASSADFWGSAGRNHAPPGSPAAGVPCSHAGRPVR